MTDREIIVRMAMSGLGSGNPATIAGWPLHYYRAVRRDWFVITGLVGTADKDDDDTIEVTGKEEGLSLE